MSIASSVLMKPWSIDISHCMSAFSYYSQTNKGKKKIPSGQLRKTYLIITKHLHFALMRTMQLKHSETNRLAWLAHCTELTPCDIQAWGSAREPRSPFKWALGTSWILLVKYERKQEKSLFTIKYWEISIW